MDMRKNKNLLTLAAACAVVVGGFASCGDSDDPSGPGLDFSDPVVTGYRMDYRLELSDQHIGEVADVLVEYIDADGNTLCDTVEGQTWAKSVTFPKGSRQVYGLAARFSPKGAPELTQDAYDFAVDLGSHLYVLYSNRSPMLNGTPANHASKGILKPRQDGSYNTERSAGYLLTQYGREDMDTTTVDYCVVSERLESGRDTSYYISFPYLDR